MLAGGSGCITRSRLTGFTYVSLLADTSGLMASGGLDCTILRRPCHQYADQAEQTFLTNYLSEPDGVTKWWRGLIQSPISSGLTDDESLETTAGLMDHP